MSQHFDTIVIGAGLAGITAAQRLTAEHRSVALIEARHRFGGRVWTHHESGLSVPLELGPEWFDKEGEMHQLLATGPGAVRAGNGEFLRRMHGKLQSVDEPDDGWVDLQRRLNEVKGKDRSLESALKECCSDAKHAESAEMLRQYVSGFHAADPNELSLEWLRTVEQSQSAGDADIRAPGGLDSAVTRLLGKIRFTCTAYLGTTVTHVRWKRGHVEVNCTSGDHTGTITANSALITLPLSILRLGHGARGSVQFTPALRLKRPAFTKLATGPVLKLNLIFDRPFWHDIARIDKALFLQDPSQPITTWWTSRPIESPVLVGWVAGPMIARVPYQEPKALLRTAIRSLAGALAVPAASVARRLQRWYFHDWQRDPFSQGAYSWVRAGGIDAHKLLAEPLEDTLYFAGEATAGNGMNATMDGAVRSGMRAANEIVDRN